MKTRIIWKSVRFLSPPGTAQPKKKDKVPPSARPLVNEENKPISSGSKKHKNDAHITDDKEGGIVGYFVGFIKIVFFSV